jgi:hypothetical protein
VRVRLLSLCFVMLLAGCAAAREGMPPVPDRRPTEAETRDAYFNTPVITDDSGAAVKAGITKPGLFRLFGGRAAIDYERRGLDCVIYPIIGTQVWDDKGVPVAAEWEFCFEPGGALAAKRRLPVGS